MTLSIIGLQPTPPTRVMGLRTIVLFIIVYRIVFLFTIFNLIQSEFTCLYCLVIVIVVVVDDFVVASTCYAHIWLQIQILRFFYCFIDCLESWIWSVCLPACLFGLSTPSGFSLSQPHYSFPTRPLFNNAHQCDIHTSSTYIRIYIFILFIYPNEFYCKSKYWALWSASISLWDLRSVIRNLN